MCSPFTVENQWTVVGKSGAVEFCIHIEISQLNSTCAADFV
jgi:hypothetical protein